MSRMKMLLGMAILALMCGCATTGGRRSVPIENIEGCTVTVVNGQPMREIIMRAAHRKLWLPQALDDHTVRCTLKLRSHQVVVDVVYTESAFSIRYVSSENMRHDSGANTISPKYNQWIRNLQREIVGQSLKR